MIIRSAEDLEVYKKAYSLAMNIFVISSSFPSEERYSLTDQIRRSSRSVCANLQEAWAKRRYPAHFTSKLTDADGESNETRTWINFALDCKYVDKETHQKLTTENLQVGAMLGKMLQKPEPFLQTK